jgi:hypothetical protein
MDKILPGQPAKGGLTKDLKLNNGNHLSNDWGAPLAATTGLHYATVSKIIKKIE